MMRVFTLDIDEFATVLGFLDARLPPGMSEESVRAPDRQVVADAMAKLRAHGWMSPGDRPETWHFNAELLHTLAVSTSPEHVVLVRSFSQRRSALFYFAGEEMVELVASPERVMVIRLDTFERLVQHVVAFLGDALPGEVLVAGVRGATLTRGHCANIDLHGTMTTTTRRTTPVVVVTWGTEPVGAFLRDALAELRR